MIEDAIVLAGGLGTRLREAVKDLPKPMAPIRGKPFLGYLLDFLARQGVRRVALSVGYRHEAILGHFGSRYNGLELAYAVEPAPLGTGGGIRLALPLTRGDDVLVFNGDTHFEFDLAEFVAAHLRHPTLTIALKAMRDFDRYEVVRIGPAGRITGFEERGPRAHGLINGGVYALNRAWFLAFPLPDAFSFEADFLQKRFRTAEIYGVPMEGAFIDIGIPEDYERAQSAVGLP